MYGIPSDLNYSSMIGKFATQICVGQFDIQFTLGDFCFIIQSPIQVYKDGIRIGGWDAASWPDSAFYDLMNVAVAKVDLPDNKTMRIAFENGLVAELADDSDRYETMQIVVGKAPGAVYIV
jgi:hypothetical protein